MQRYILPSIILFVIGLCIVASLAFRDEISFYSNLYRAFRAGKRFYNQYPLIARNVDFHQEIEPRLDVYSPDEGRGHPVLVFVHGGSWKNYDKELFAPVAMKLLPEGLVVVIPDYTLYPEAGYDQMASEVAAALSWTLENIEQYGGDPQKVVVAGHSAGAHLSGLAMLDPRFLSTYGHSSGEFCGWLGLSGVYDIQAEYDHWQAKGVTPKVILGVTGGQHNFRQASPIHHVRPELPPTLLIHGDEDETVPAQISIDMQTALQAAGASSVLVIYPERGHSDYLFAALIGESAHIVDDITGFVQRCAQ